MRTIRAGLPPPLWLGFLLATASARSSRSSPTERALTKEG